jgi:hypothetical protein
VQMTQTCKNDASPTSNWRWSSGSYKLCKCDAPVDCAGKWVTPANDQHCKEVFTITAPDPDKKEATDRACSFAERDERGILPSASTDDSCSLCSAGSGSRVGFTVQYTNGRTVSGLGTVGCNGTEYSDQSNKNPLYVLVAGETAKAACRADGSFVFSGCQGQRMPPNSCLPPLSTTFTPVQLGQYSSLRFLACVD